MRRLLFCAAVLLALLPGLCKTGQVDAAGTKTQQSTVAQNTGPANASGYVGSTTCMMCHADVAKSFATNPHSRLALMHNGKGSTCESCHGPGKAHVDSGGDPTKIFNFHKASAKQINATCLECHTADHPNFERSPHSKAGLSCINCHSIHSPQTEAHLLRAPQPTLCFTCHTGIKPAFAQPFHHPVDEGVMKCTDCHDPHGTFQDAQLRTVASQNQICTKCHIENAGPFVFEHPPVKTEGCIFCHNPHGSPNPRMLVVNNVNTLCLQCHTDTMNFTAPGAPSFHNQQAQYQACTLCHVAIHGSNVSDVFFQ